MTPLDILSVHAKMQGNREWLVLTLLRDVEVDVLWLGEVAGGDGGDVVFLVPGAASRNGHEGYTGDGFFLVGALIVVVIGVFIIIAAAAALDEVVVTVEDILRQALAGLAMFSWLHVAWHTARRLDQSLVGFIVRALHFQCVLCVGDGGLRFRGESAMGVVSGGAIGGGSRTTKP